MSRCSGFVPSRGFHGHCIHGFPQSVACDPGSVVAYSPPHCVNEKWCGRMYPDGKPEPLPLTDKERTKQENPS